MLAGCWLLVATTSAVLAAAQQSITDDHTDD